MKRALRMTVHTSAETPHSESVVIYIAYTQYHSLDLTVSAEKIVTTVLTRTTIFVTL